MNPCCFCGWVIIHAEAADYISVQKMIDLFILLVLIHGSPHALFFFFYPKLRCSNIFFQKLAAVRNVNLCSAVIKLSVSISSDLNYFERGFCLPLHSSAGAQYIFIQKQGEKRALLQPDIWETTGVWRLWQISGPPVCHPKPSTGSPSANPFPCNHFCR